MWSASGALGDAIAQSPAAIGARGHTSSGVVGEATAFAADLPPAPEKTGAGGTKRGGAQLAGMCSLAVLEHVEISVPTPVEGAERSLDSTHFLLIGLEVRHSFGARESATKRLSVS